MTWWQLILIFQKHLMQKSALSLSHVAEAAEVAEVVEVVLVVVAAALAPSEDPA